MAAPQSLAGVRVLAVDDEADALTLVRDVLEAAGATVMTADSAEQALQALATERPRRDDHRSRHAEDGRLRAARSRARVAGVKRPSAASRWRR